MLSTPEFRGVPLDQIPLTAKVDYWHRAIQDLSGSAIGQGNLKRSLTSLSKSVTDPLKTANPEWAAATSSWSTPSKFLEAIDTGRSVLSPSTSAEEWAATLKDMTPNELEGARIGALSAITGKMQSNSAITPDLTKEIRSVAMREKVAALMPDPVSADKWRRIVDTEVKMADLGRRSTGNSQTPLRLAEQQDRMGPGSMMLEGAAGLVTNSPLYALLRGMKAGVGRIRDTGRSRADLAAAKLLMSPNVPGALSRVSAPPPVGYGRPGMAGPALASPVVQALASQRPSQ